MSTEDGLSAAKQWIAYLNAELDKARGAVAVARTERDVAIRDCAHMLVAQRDAVAETLGRSHETTMGDLCDAIRLLRWLHAEAVWQRDELDRQKTAWWEHVSRERHNLRKERDQAREERDGLAGDVVHAENAADHYRREAARFRRVELVPADPESRLCSCHSTTLVRIHIPGTYCGDAMHERLAAAVGLAGDPDAETIVATVLAGLAGPTEGGERNG